MTANHYDPRTIALLSEIIHPPLELEPKRAQSIHNELYRHAQFSYQNFGVSHDGIQLGNQSDQPGYVSTVNFLSDRIQIREELSGAHVDDFCQRLVHVIGVATEQLSLPILVAQQHVVRSLITPRSFNDSRDFLATAVCGLPSEDLSSFGRPAQLFGMKMIFPGTDNEPNMHTLRLESFNQDSRSVFLENVATFTNAVMPDNLDELAENMQQTYNFVRKNALEFLSRYDESGPTG
ncbi:MAG: hypothetical protein CMJ85_14285 [Planctomycetes bacterium]|jgi:hypothetical protein|nr:hypothetical protein [Planctomycetota bacterium]